MSICTAAMASLTMCIKAQRVLSPHGISVSTVKLDSSITGAGCAYGMEFLCEDKKQIRAILDSAGIQPTKYINSGGGRPL